MGFSTRCSYRNVLAVFYLGWQRRVEVLSVNPLKTQRICVIQGVSRLEGITAGGDFPGLCDQKSSHKHVSDFGRLRSYGHFLIPVHALVWTASHGTSWRVMYSTWWLIFCVASIIFATWLAQFTTERQPLLRPTVAFSKTSFEHRSFQIKDNLTKLTLHLCFKCIMYYAGLLFWTHVYMDFFLSQRPRKSPPAVMSSSRETPCILLFYCNNGYANEPQRYAIGALPVLFQVGF